MRVTVTKPSCTATKPNGERCKQAIVNADGLCAYHAGQNDVRAAGRRGGLRPRGAGGRTARGFREHLLDVITPASVAQAIESGLASDKESDRIAAARLLLAEVAEPPRPAVVEPPPSSAYDRAAMGTSLADLIRFLASEADGDGRGPRGLLAGETGDALIEAGLKVARFREQGAARVELGVGEDAAGA